MRKFAESIVDTVGQPQLVLDSNLRIVRANPPFLKTFQTAAEHVEGSLIDELTGGQWNNAGLIALLNQVLQQGVSLVDFELELESPNQARRSMVLNARRIFDEEHAVPMILLTIDETTEQQQIHLQTQIANIELERRVEERTQSLAVANKALLESNRELEAFCYSVSHDLRTPLRAIDGFSRELLNPDGNLSEEQARHYLSRVCASAQRMGQLIDDLLNLSRVGRTEMRLQLVDLSSMAGEIIEELRQSDPTRQLLADIQPGLTAMCDPSLIRIVLDNLIRNAWKFSSRKDAVQIEFGFRDVAEQSGFFVADHGAGFDMTYADKLFGAFHRLHSEHEFPGTGIGLATVRRIVHRHGGKVWATGTVDAGAAFYFSLSSAGEGS
ncbi:sensor histidine kinase [Planctomicrobium piriforme]|uniref:histidine kinase n=1 Tax=Planctomicrobium piriforme TaxID=1576369 RepID=A0A1I3SSR1_9PLAN|nr:ATP-binding protein [Planctomicrobium piriforme]SFJ60621.1 hypothetical protein SAMN05421753_12529 [Planctomicrobium piriforme]